MSARTPDIPPSELEALKTLWDGGPAPVREVMRRLHANGSTVAYTTVLTLLNRLEARGLVTKDTSQSAFIYEAAVSRDRVVGARLKQVARQLFDGATAPMVMHLMESERFSAEELAELRRLLDELVEREHTTSRPRKAARSSRKRPR